MDACLCAQAQRADCLCYAGSFLVIPAGISQQGPGAEAVNTTYVYARGQWKTPVAHLPALDAPTVAVRFCPQLFKLRPSAPSGSGAAGSSKHSTSPDSSAPAASADRAAAQPAADAPTSQASRQPPQSTAEEEGSAPWTALPHRMLFAVASMDSVVIYDTQVRSTCCVHAVPEHCSMLHRPLLH